MKEFLKELKNSSLSIIPIYVLVLFLRLFKLIHLTGVQIAFFSLSTLIIIFGVALFSLGSQYAMAPIGRDIGRNLTNRGNIKILLILCFLFGFLVTIAEPDLNVLATQTSSVFPKSLLIICISLSVALFVVFAILKVVNKANISTCLCVMYLICFMLLSLNIRAGNENIIGLCFDAGGVTTGPITVPFMMAMGVGISSIISKRSEKDASFGFVAFSSVGPVLVMLVLSLVFPTQNFNMPHTADSEAGFLSNFLHHSIIRIKDVGISVGLIAVCYYLIDFAFIHSSPSHKLNLLKGLAMASLGLVLFLSSVDCQYMPLGQKIGKELSLFSQSGTWKIVLICFLIGSLTVVAEPAVKILTSQVEEVTNGAVKQKTLLLTLAFGTGFSVLVAFLRVIYGFSILYVLVLGYGICFILSLFVPRIYTAIAFDAGAVASGPLTSSFILPVVLGFCNELRGEENVLFFGFGIVALVALSPLFFIELLGALSLIRTRYLRKKSLKGFLSKDSGVIIPFSDYQKTAQSNIKLYLVVVTVPKGKSEVISDILSRYEATYFLTTLARGSVDRELTKDILISILRQDKIKDALLEIEDKFNSFNQNSKSSDKVSMYYSVELDKIIGVNEYLILSNGGAK